MPKLTQEPVIGPWGGPRPRGPRRSVPAEPSRQLDVEGVEVEVAAAVSAASPSAAARRRSGVARAARCGVLPGSLGAARVAAMASRTCAVAAPMAAATVRATHLVERPAPPPRWLTSPSPDHYSPAA